MVTMCVNQITIEKIPIRAATSLLKFYTTVNNKAAFSFAGCSWCLCKL
uniref:Uncharacterized protein n=1 Tax=Arundo donax TaxID=35708 RepID=A0A0A8Z7P2_ARUDO